MILTPAPTSAESANAKNSENGSASKSATLSGVGFIKLLCVGATMSTPKHILKRIRKRLDLDEQDDSQDGYINQMTPHQKLREVVAWELGDPDWADTILQWARDCGMTVDA